MSGVVDRERFKSEGDWINVKLSEYATGADGRLSIEKLKAIAKENDVEHKSHYPNPGMWRMNIGNMLRAKVRREGQLIFEGKVHKMPGWKPASGK